MRLRRLAVSAAVLGLTTMGLGACADDTKSESSGPSTAGSSPSAPQSSASPSASTEDEATDGGSSDAVEPAAFVRRLTAAQLRAGSAHVTMAMTGAARMRAVGDMAFHGSRPEMRMTMSMAQMGTGRMEMRFVHGILYMAMPPMTPPGKFLKIDPNDASNPLSSQMGGLSEQMDPLQSMRALQGAVRSIHRLGTAQVDGAKTDHYRMKVDTAELMKASGKAGLAGAAQLPDTLTYDVWLDQQDLLRRMTFDVGPVDTTMTMSSWGEDVSVQAPPASSVVKLPKR